MSKKREKTFCKNAFNSILLFLNYRILQKKVKFRKKWGVLEKSGGILYNFVPTTINKMNVCVF